MRTRTSLLAAACVVVATTALAEIDFRWEQEEPPPVDTYQWTLNRTPQSGWVAGASTPEMTPNRTPPMTPGRYRRPVPAAAAYGTKGIRLRACNTGGCGEDSPEEFVWPTLTPTASPTLSPTPTVTVRALPTRPSAPRLL